MASKTAQRADNDANTHAALTLTTIANMISKHQDEAMPLDVDAFLASEHVTLSPHVSNHWPANATLLNVDSALTQLQSDLPDKDLQLPTRVVAQHYLETVQGIPQQLEQTSQVLSHVQTTRDTLARVLHDIKQNGP